MYTFFWRDNRNSMRNVETYLSSFLKSRSNLVASIDSLFIASDYLEQNCYIKSTGVQAASRAGRLYLNQRFSSRLFERLRRDVKRFWRYAYSLRRKKIIDFSNRELLAHLKKLNALTINLWPYFVISQAEYFYDVEDRLRGLVSQHVLSERFDGTISTLVTPRVADRSMQAQTEWVNLVRKNPSNHQLLSYALRHPALFFPGVWSDAAAVAMLKKRLRHDRRRVRNLVSEEEKLLKKKQELRREQKQLYRSLSPQVHTMSNMLQTWGILRFEVKFCWAGVEFVLGEFFGEIGRRIRVPISDLMHTYREDEVVMAIQTGKRLSPVEVKKRLQAYLFRLKGKKLVFTSGQAARLEFAKLLGKRKGPARILTGRSANIGRAQGEVQIVPISALVEIQRAVKRFPLGAILVTPMTQPNMIPIIRKAGAIVTDEGGITSHAAVVSREFGIPCIVGTHDATKVFKDGDRVEVDATKGIVRKL